MNIFKDFASLMTLSLFVLMLLSAQLGAESLPNTATQVGTIKDGKYTGKAKGYDDDITAEIEINGGKIKNIRIIENHESQPKDALEKIPRKIVEKQSADTVDAVSGATYTSNGIIKAVKNALNQAAGKIKVHAPSADPEKNPEMSDQIKLPDPKLNPEKSLADALKNRRSVRAFDTQKELSLQTLSNLLWAASGINRANGRMTAPTAFDWREIEIFTAMKKGVFKYDPRKNMLTRVSDSDIRESCGFQTFTKDAPVVLIFVANYWKMTGQGGPDMLRFYAAIDTGYVSQNVYLFCASENLATVVLGGVDKPALEKLINIRPGNQSVIMTQPVGYPANPDDVKN